MKKDKISQLNTATKVAWQDNWEAVDMEQVLEIFSYERVRKQMDIFLRHLDKNSIVLEGGCGLSPYVIKLRQLGYHVVGVDYNISPLSKVKRFQPSTPLLCSDVEHTPFKDESFGAYLSLGVIEHFAQGPQAAIREAHRILKGNGIFLVQIPTKNIFKTIKAPVEALKRSAILRKIFRKPARVYYWKQYFKPKELSRMLESGGFTVKEVIPIDHTHSLCTFCAPLFRDKTKYDEANSFGLTLGNLLEKILPWSTANEAIFVCQKRDNAAGNPR
jgi:SAM-dependent methyltransferase